MLWLCSREWIKAGKALLASGKLLGGQMRDQLTRRDFNKALALGAATMALPSSLLAAKTRNIRIGHTGITWPGDQVDQAVKDVAELGFAGFETFGRTLQQWEEKGGFGQLLEKYNLPLISGYCSFNMTEKDKRQESMEQMKQEAALVKKYGGKVIVLGPNGVKREEYNFADYKSTIIESINEVSKMITDMGLTPAFHQHTGTCVESREETYAVMEAVDTRYVKFGPDIGQLQKGGSDPVQVVKDFLSIVHHMHLKDYNGGPYYLGYCPLGEGKVNIPAILDMVEGRKMKGMVMVELDGGGRRNPPPESPLEAATKAKNYLIQQGVKFKNS
jgi:inosose dehydratase